MTVLRTEMSRTPQQSRDLRCAPCTPLAAMHARQSDTDSDSHLVYEVDDNGILLLR